MTENVSAAQFPREFLDFFWGISNEDSTRRITAVKDLLVYLVNAQANQKTLNGASKKETPHLTYTLKRLLNGLSGSDNGRQGFAIALTEVKKTKSLFNHRKVLSSFKFLDIVDVHKKLVSSSDYKQKDLSSQERRSRCFGRIAGYLSMFRAQRLSELLQQDSMLESCINEILTIAKVSNLT
jgi:hypothetical protein